MFVVGLRCAQHGGTPGPALLIGKTQISIMVIIAVCISSAVDLRKWDGVQMGYKRISRCNLP